MSFLQRVNFKNLIINIALYLLAVIVLFVLLNWFLKWYTHHGESLTVPDLRGRTVEEIQKIVDEKDLRFEIKDSVYSPNDPPLSVISQNPKAGSKVKRGRRIYVILNTDRAPLIPLPVLDNVPLRQAERILSSYNIHIDSTRYIPDIALNAVLAVEYKQRPIQAGTKIPKGSGVVLVLGDGGQTQKTEAPDLRGKTLDEAIFILRGNNLNLGATQFDPDTKDSAKAIIYKQRPLPESGKTISQGSAIDVYLMDADKYRAQNGGQ